MGFLGDARQALPMSRSTGSAICGAAGDLHVALGTAIAVVDRVVGVALGLGAWRTKTREI